VAIVYQSKKPADSPTFDARTGATVTGAAAESNTHPHTGAMCDGAPTGDAMKKDACTRDKNTSRAIGLVLLPLALVLSIPLMLMIPVIGALAAAAVLALAGIFVMAPKGEACRITG
jgi:hypothetical protein